MVTIFLLYKYRRRIRTLEYFFLCGIPEMWKMRKLCIKAAWFVSRVMAAVDINKESRK